MVSEVVVRNCLCDRLSGGVIGYFFVIVRWMFYYYIDVMMFVSMDL